LESPVRTITSTSEKYGGTCFGDSYNTKVREQSKRVRGTVRKNTEGRARDKYARW
jgi:hypothetical protein